MNAYTSISGGGFQAPSPSYDANGNTLSLPRPDGTSQVLAWDIHNRLRSVNASSTQMTYDPRGRLVWLRNTNGTNPATDKIWSWSSWTLLAREVVQGGTPLDTFRYTWGPDLSGTLEGAGGVGGLLAIEHAAGSSTTWDIRHVHYDANGNVLALTNDAGQISARYRYSPFGELVVSQNVDNSGWNERNIHRFSTKPEVAGTGLLYYGYRWYDPATGRWPSRDPIEEKGGVNLYGFVDNNGVDSHDLLGMVKHGESCSNCCVKCEKTGAALVTDNGSAGWTISLVAISPRFASKCKDSGKCKADCCDIKYDWYDCYSGKCDSTRTGKYYTKEIKYNPDASAALGLRVNLLSYTFCSCENGTWNCSLQRTKVGFGSGFSYAVDSKTTPTRWVRG